MSLQNLLAIQRLQAFETTPSGIQRLLTSAVRNLTDNGGYDSSCRSYK